MLVVGINSLVCPPKGDAVVGAVPGAYRLLRFFFFNTNARISYWYISIRAVLSPQ